MKDRSIENDWNVGDLVQHYEKDRVGVVFDKHVAEWSAYSTPVGVAISFFPHGLLFGNQENLEGWGYTRVDSLSYETVWDGEGEDV